jgi:ABC-2 type transport system permease protein
VITGLRVALWAEIVKFRRSRVPWLTWAGLALPAPMVGLLMIALRDPAKAPGLLGGKAGALGVTSDWKGYFTLLLQIHAVGGLLVFGVLTAWVFGREFSDRTAIDLLALPISRTAIVTAKFVVIVCWSAVLSGFLLLMRLAVGGALGLPGWSSALLVETVRHLAVLSALNVVLLSPVALGASIGRGYMPAVGLMLLIIFLAQGLASVGFGAWFPWSVPALASGMAGPSGSSLGLASYVLVGVTAVGGAVLTMTWWRLADQD